MEKEEARERERCDLTTGDVLPPGEKWVMFQVVRRLDNIDLETKQGSGIYTNAWYVIPPTPGAVGPKISRIFQDIKQDPPLRRAACAVVDSSMYHIGGFNLSERPYGPFSGVLSIDLRYPHQGWKRCDLIADYKRHRLITEVIGSKIYVIGGNRYNGVTYADWGYILDTVSESCMPLNPPLERCFPAACAVLDGGSDRCGPRGLVVYFMPLTSLYLHNLETNSWELYDGNFGRSLDGPYVVSNRILYIYHAYHLKEKEQRCLHCYDLVNRSWLPEIHNLEKDGAVPSPDYMDETPPFRLVSIADGTLCALWDMISCQYGPIRSIHCSKFLVSHDTVLGVSHAHVKDKMVFYVNAVEINNYLAFDPTSEIAEQVFGMMNQEQQQ